MRDRLIALGVIAGYTRAGDGSGDTSGGGGIGGGSGGGTPPPPPPAKPTANQKVPQISGNKWNPKKPAAPTPNPAPTPTPTINPNPHQVNSTPTPTPRTIKVDPAGATVPNIYGLNALGGNTPYRPIFVHAIPDSTNRYLTCVWVIGMGPISAVSNLAIQSHPFAALGLTLGSTYNVYLGTSSQTPDPLLVAADPTGYGSTGFPGVAYIVAKLDGNQGIASKVDPTILSCTVQGLLVRDPRLNPNAGTAPTAAAGSAGLPSGFYDWNVTFVDGSGNESPGCAVPSNAITLASQQGSLTAVPTGPAGTASRNIYRRVKSTGAPFKLAGSIANNTGTTFTDNVADASLGVEIPYVSTQRAYSTNPALCHADFRASRRYGFNIADSMINWTDVANAANDCDFAVATPSASPGAAPTYVENGPTTGNLVTGLSYAWVYSWVVAGVETGSSPASSTLFVDSAHQLCSATLTFPSTPPAGTTAVRVYRNNGLSLSLTNKVLVTEIAGTPTTYTDVVGDTQLQATPAPPSSPGTVPRYQIGISLAKLDTMPNWDAALGAHYSAYFSHDTQWHVFVDLARTASAIVFDTTNIIGELQISTMGLAQRWSRVAVSFYNAMKGYQQDTAAAEHPYYALPPTETQREERRETDLQLDGVQSFDQAKRIATQIFNRARLNKQVIFMVMARGLRCMPGIVVSVTHPTGPLSSTPVIVTGIEWSTDGSTFQLTGEFYDPTVYLDTVQINPSPILPPGPSPFATPPDPTNVTLTEVDVIGPTGQQQANIVVSWTPYAGQFYYGTKVQHSTDGGVTWVEDGTFAAGPYTLPTAQLNVLYTFKLQTILVTFVASLGATATITPVLTSATVPDVDQAFLSGVGYLNFTGPIQSYAATIINVPLTAPVLAGNLGGIVPVGTYGVAYSWTNPAGDTLMSPVAQITIASGHQILAFSSVTDGPSPATLLKKIYITNTNDPTGTLYVASTLNPGSTSGTMNSAAGWVAAENAAPVYYPFVSQFLVYDNFAGYTQPILIASVDPHAPPQHYNPISVQAAIHPDPTTGLPRIDLLVYTINTLGIRSTGKSYSNTSVVYPNVPQQQLAIQQAASGLSNGANNNVAVGAGNLRITGPSSAFNITGFVGGLAGVMIVIINTTAQQMTLSHQNAGSTAANRIICPGGADIVYTNQDQCVQLLYDATSSRWRVLNP